MKKKILKVIAWRIISILITFCVLALTTGDVGSATYLTLALHALLTLCHFGFEHFWEKKINAMGS